MLFLLFLRPALAGQQTILIVGDSISAAYGMSLEQGWVAIMAGQIAETHPDYSVVNASISGETSGGGLQRLPGLLEQHRPAVVVIELGGNDGLRGYPLLTLRSNLSGMVKLSEESGAEVIIIPMEIPPNYGKRYIEGFRESYIIVTENSNGILAPFLLDGIATSSNMMQADGIHPTIEVQTDMVENFLPTLLKVLP